METRAGELVLISWVSVRGEAHPGQITSPSRRNSLKKAFKLLNNLILPMFDQSAFFTLTSCQYQFRSVIFNKLSKHNNKSF